MDHFPLTEEQRESRRQAFIDSIDTNAVCRLASQYNNSKPCRIFQATTRGSFNVCFFIEFLDDDKRWVVRIPIEPAIYNVWDKVQSEVTTIRYIESNTTIPVPHVHGFGRGIDQQNPIGYTYLILDYIPGQPLDKQAFVKDTRERRNHFYSQLIDMLAQLRQHEFNFAGSLMPDPDSGTNPVIGHLLSIPLNELQVDRGSSSVPQVTRFTSAIDFAFYQYHIMSEAYQSPTSELSLRTAQLEVFALNDLKARIFGFIDPRWNHGPFVLAHTDLRWANIIVDDGLNIRGIIDWEWAGTVPRQLFMPPTWIGGGEPDCVAGIQYRLEYAEFFNVLSTKGITCGICRQLAEEWGPDLPKGLDLPMAAILRHHSQMIHIYYLALYPKFFKTPREDTVPQFFEQDGKDGPFTLEVHRRVKHSERFTQFLKDNGLFVANVAAQKIREWMKKRQEMEERWKLRKAEAANTQLQVHGCR